MFGCNGPHLSHRSIRLALAKTQRKSYTRSPLRWFDSFALPENCQSPATAVHCLSSQAVRRALNLWIGFPAPNLVKRAGPGDPKAPVAPLRSNATRAGVRFRAASSAGRQSLARRLRWPARAGRPARESAVRPVPRALTTPRAVQAAGQGLPERLAAPITACRNPQPHPAAPGPGHANLQA